MIPLHLECNKHTWNSAFKSPPGYFVCYDTFSVHSRSLFFHAFNFSFENIHTSLHTSYQARPSRRWLISSCIFTSVSWLKSLRGVKSPRGDFPRSEMEDGDSGLGLSSMVVSCHLSSPLMKLFILRDLDSGDMGAVTKYPQFRWSVEFHFLKKCCDVIQLFALLI